MHKKKTEKHQRFFPAKLLLFGEHTVNKGSAGLAVPTNLFEGYFQSAEILNTNQAASNQSLELLANYIIFNEKLSNIIDTNRLLSDIENGLFFNSTIPQGYGLGSSGALAAAVLNVYGIKVNHRNISAIKEILADMESYFHGKSSGLDALVSYLNKSVFITKEKIETIDVPDFNKCLLKFFLLDTGKRRNTSTFVNLFLKKADEKTFAQKVERLLVPAVNLCIDSFLQRDPIRLFKSFGMLSQHQLDMLPEFIPDGLHSLWKDGLNSRNFYLKICGAGGGGFMLGICKPDFDPQIFFPANKILFL